MANRNIIVIGTLDIIGKEYRFLKGWLEAFGVSTLVINTGIVGKPGIHADISADEVAIAGGSSRSKLRREDNLSNTVEVMSKGAAAIVKGLHEKKQVDGIISLGGSNNTIISTAAMRALPIGIPKLMVSTLASGDTRPFVMDKDITMMPAIVDTRGLNLVSRRVYMNAAAAMAAMTKLTIDSEVKDKPCIAATIYGVTTPCVYHAKALLEKAGYEVLVFHAVGIGGLSMEHLIEGGYIKGVLDVTTTELADYLMDGDYSAGPTRLETAGEKGIPQVVAPGALDMVNFGTRDSIKDCYKNRKMYTWRSLNTLMRTNTEENQELGELIAKKLNKAKGPTTFISPNKGFSSLDSEGKAFYDPEADKALTEAVKSHLNKKVKFIDTDLHINDPLFAETMVKVLLDCMNTKVKVSKK